MDPLLTAAWLTLMSAAVALLFVDDWADVGVRAARTAVQTALGLGLAMLVSDSIEYDPATHLLVPAIVAGATVVHGALQPAIRAPK